MRRAPNLDRTPIGAKPIQRTGGQRLEFDYAIGQREVALSADLQLLE